MKTLMNNCGKKLFFSLARVYFNKIFATPRLAQSPFAAQLANNYFYFIFSHTTFYTGQK